MADKNNGGDKTEKPTPKRLKDAQKKGDVPKSRDLTGTAALGLWIVLLGFSIGYIAERLAHLTTMVISVPDENFTFTLFAIGQEAINTLLIITALLLIPIIFFSLLIEFLQTGPILTAEKFKPKMEHLNPAAGLKRMFSMDNLVEVIKSIAKTAILFFIGWLVFKLFLPELVLLPQSSAAIVSKSLWETSFKLLSWTLAIFSLIAFLDISYQRYSFTKKMRMSMRDIKQEVKDSEGDPLIKQQRRQTHQEWAEQSAVTAAGNANALIVNPTHIAIAINYDKESSPVPMVAAKGQDDLALRMREAAEEHDVPIVRNISLARQLLRDSEEGRIIPRELFDMIAEVILWAQEVKEEINRQREGESLQPSPRQYKAPGEDLTFYPQDIGTH